MTTSNANLDNLHPRLRDSLEKVRPEMDALEESDLQSINLDPLAAAGTIQGALSRVMSLRPRIVEELPKFNLKYLDNLQLYSLTMMQATGDHLGEEAPPENLVAIAAEAAALREQLVSDATALANRGLISAIRLGALKGPIGFRNNASDILMLNSMLRKNWSNIEGKCAITLAELDRGEVIAEQLVSAIGTKELAPSTLAEGTIDRQRAYTLMMRAYDQVRRAVIYLRWDEGDVDSIAPSLYAGRSGSRKKSGSELETKVEPPPATQPATVATITTTPAASTTQPTAIGLPGADPFVH